jgi:hypothetical protein
LSSRLRALRREFARPASVLSIGLICLQANDLRVERGSNPTPRFPPDDTAGLTA